MKRLMMGVLILVMSMKSHAQNFNEWFRQKKTQIDYLVRQIAGLQVYIELGQKGYGLYRDGLAVIGELKDGEFNLHKDYFASLSEVKPSIANMREVNDMLYWHRQVQVFAYEASRQRIGSEQASVASLYNGLIDASQRNVNQLTLLVSSGGYQLRDEGLIHKIQQLYAEQKEVYAMARTTFLDVLRLRAAQGGVERDVRTGNAFHGLP